MPEKNRRIDFLCVGEGDNLVIVEIKRPESKVSKEELDQIEEYVNFMRDQIKKSTDPSYRYKKVTGILLCGDLVSGYQASGKKDNLAEAEIYVRRYMNLLNMVKRAHTEFLNRYNQLREAKQKSSTI